MVKHILIDCSRMTSKETLHRCLQETLSLPEYYGGNLDALFDCLTEVSQPVVLEFEHPDALIPLGNYGEALMATFRDAALENPMLTLV